MGKGGGKAHTPVEAKDNLKSTQMMSVIDAIGEGPVEGPVKGLQSILVNKTPLTDTDGNPVIHGVTAVWRAGEQEQTPDGSLKPAYSNNPAWCLWDMLTHPRYGMGKRLGAADVDKWALYAIAQYCDQTVPDGFGGTEPRMTFNAYLSQQRKAWDVLSDFCSAMRCMPVWNGQTLTFVQDRPSDVVWPYTN
ncbi:phage tail protein, partial [Escherichia coli]|uniref:phage tail protein n=1 Tax=Escherichia coli TaxID=562 RepID=UPI001112EA29